MSNYTTPEEAVAGALADLGEFGSVEDFDGFNCDDVSDENCGGWDGVSRRCYCGNRRVEWLTEKYADGTWFAYASAY